MAIRLHGLNLAVLGSSRWLAMKVKNMLFVFKYAIYKKNKFRNEKSSSHEN
jgi:hypothetical protein